MAKPIVVAEWRVCDSEIEWQTAQTRDLPLAVEMALVKRVRIRRIWWVTGMAALLMLVVTGAWVWHAAQTGLTQIDAELSAAVAQEWWALQEGRTDLAASLATGAHNKEFQAQLKRDYALLEEYTAATLTAGEILAEIELVRLRADQATVRVLFEIGDESFRQTRFYRRTTDGWRQIWPGPDELGEWQRLETQYLTIGYFDVDAAAVAEAAPQLDAFVGQMRTDLGLAGVAPNAKYQIEIAYHPDLLERTLATRSPGSTNIPTVSPLPQFMPSAISEGAAIVQLAELQFAYPLVREALEQHDEQWRSTASLWLPLLSALALWEFWESDAPLAVWKADIVTWRHARLANLPAHHEDICRAYRKWRLSPWTMEIPLECDAKVRELFPVYTMPRNLRSLHDPAFYLYEPEATAELESQVVDLVPVLDYVVATYGRDRLPLLVGALGEHQDWESLIPAVFGVPVHEFELGWQTYMSQRMVLQMRPPYPMESMPSRVTVTP